MGRITRTVGMLAVVAGAVAPAPAPGQDRPQQPDVDAKAIQEQVRAETARQLDASRQARAAARRRADQLPLIQVDAILKDQAANRDRMARETLQHLAATFASELRLLTSAAGPTPEQRREIAIEAGRTLRLYFNGEKEIAADRLRVAAQANDPAANRLRVAIANEPRKLVRMHIETAAWPRLSNQQSASYRAEAEARELARRDVVILNVVANIDRHLRLKPGQRERICESLRAHWDDRDYPTNFLSIDYDQHVAIVPDLYMMEILDEDQLKVWRGLRKYHFSALRCTDIFGGLLGPEEEIVLDEDTIAALGGEAKK